jgi:hypothetical protein
MNRASRMIMQSWTVVQGRGRCTEDAPGGGRYLRVKREIAKLEPGEELALDALDELQIAARDGHLVRVRLGLGLSFELGLGFSFLLGFGLGLV